MRARLQKIRKSYGYTQKQFADVLNISRSHYCQIETGEKAPSLKVAIRIKNALDYHNDDIFENKNFFGK